MRDGVVILHTSVTHTAPPSPAAPATARAPAAPAAAPAAAAMAIAGATAAAAGKGGERHRHVQRSRITDSHTPPQPNTTRCDVVCTGYGDCCSGFADACPDVCAQAPACAADQTAASYNSGGGGGGGSGSGSGCVIFGEGEAGRGLRCARHTLAQRHPLPLSPLTRRRYGSATGYYGSGGGTGSGSGNYGSSTAGCLTLQMNDDW